jgi:hypothetical protein
MSQAAADARYDLWLLVLAPALWAAHFIASYAVAAIWCGRFAGAFETVRATIVVFTVVALAGIVLVGAIGLRRHRLGSAPLPHDDDTPEDRHRFLGFATLLLSALSAVAVIYAAMAAVFIETCR